MTPRIVAAAAILAILATPAMAKDLTITLNDQEQQSWIAGVMPAYNGCIAALTMKEDAAPACAPLKTFLQGFAEKVAKAKQAADAVPPAPPAPEPPK